MAGFVTEQHEKRNTSVDYLSGYPELRQDPGLAKRRQRVPPLFLPVGLVDIAWMGEFHLLHVTHRQRL
jgi:hypothetical protein